MESQMEHHLIEAIAPMKALARKVQNEKLTNEQRHELLDELNIQYMRWLGKAQMILGPHLAVELMQEYKGGIFNPGIQAFLQRGWMLYKYYKEGNPFTPRWVVDVEKAFINRLDEQLRIVAHFL
jgi:hypothetical protein